MGLGAIYGQVNATIVLSCGEVLGTDLDAPSQGTTLNYVVITNNEITHTEVIQDNLQGAQRGWDPDGETFSFQINDIPVPDISNSVVVRLIQMILLIFLFVLLIGSPIWSSHNN